jgi:hypothetical protein
VLRSEGAKTSAILRAEGEAKAIDTVFNAIHAGRPDKALLSYQYLQMLPQLAQGPANKIFVIPSEFNQALGNIAEAIGDRLGGPGGNGAPHTPSPEVLKASEDAAADAAEAAAAAKAAEEAAHSAADPARGLVDPTVPPPSTPPPAPPAA